MRIECLERIADEVIPPILETTRIPGIGIAAVYGDELPLAKGYGFEDLSDASPITADTIYPIASTSKSMNATLIGMLIEEGRLAWDRPVQDYLPRFRLGDPVVSAQVTLRDLLCMRTGLPRHDWVWIESGSSRAQITESIRHLELSAGFRQQFQYCNLSAMVAGHIAEVVCGRSWEDLVRERILEPLGMSATTFERPPTAGNTQSFHETDARQLRETRRLATEVAAPSGGAIHSTVRDMARWARFNLAPDRFRPSIVRSETLREIQSPQVVAGGHPGAPSPRAAYGLGWFIDTYNGYWRIGHPGYLHDVNSEVSLFAKPGIGIVTFVNFGPPAIARFINQLVFDRAMELQPEQSLAEVLSIYGAKLREARERWEGSVRVKHTRASHPISEYEGAYYHPAYGKLLITSADGDLTIKRGHLSIALRHWHYDVWVAAHPDTFEVFWPRAFDPVSPIAFETRATGEITALTVQLEPSVSAIRFCRRESAGA